MRLKSCTFTHIVYFTAVSAPYARRLFENEHQPALKAFEKGNGQGRKLPRMLHLRLEQRFRPELSKSTPPRYSALCENKVRGASAT